MVNGVGFEPTVGFLRRVKSPVHSTNFATRPSILKAISLLSFSVLSRPRRFSFPTLFAFAISVRG